MTQECSNHHPYQSTPRSKGLSRSKIEWSAIYTNLPVNAIVWLPTIFCYIYYILYILYVYIYCYIYYIFYYIYISIYIYIFNRELSRAFCTSMVYDSFYITWKAFLQSFLIFDRNCVPLFSEKGRSNRISSAFVLLLVAIFLILVTLLLIFRFCSSLLIIY